MAERAPWISSLRRYLLPRLLMPSSRGLPPVVICRGTSPSQAARSRPRANVPALPIAAASAVAFSTPIPGMVASRRAASSVFARTANSSSKAAIRRSRSAHSARRSYTKVRIRGLRATQARWSLPPSSSATSACSNLRRPCGAVNPRSSNTARSWLINAVRSPTRRSRTRCSDCMSSRSADFSSTKRIVGLVSPASACCLRSCRRRPTRSTSAALWRPFSVCRGRRQRNFFSQRLGQLRTADADALPRFDLGAQAGDRPVAPVGHRFLQQGGDDAQCGFTLHRGRAGRHAGLQRRDTAAVKSLRHRRTVSSRTPNASAIADWSSQPASKARRGPGPPRRDHVNWQEPSGPRVVPRLPKAEIFPPCHTPANWCRQRISPPSVGQPGRVCLDLGPSWFARQANLPADSVVPRNARCAGRCPPQWTGLRRSAGTTRGGAGRARVQ